MARAAKASKEYPVRRDPERCPAHPGELLADVVAATARGKSEIAGLPGISRQHLHDILECRKPVTAASAVRFGKLFGKDGGLWLRMQAAHDMWHAARAIDLSAIPTIKAA